MLSLSYYYQVCKGKNSRGVLVVKNSFIMIIIDNNLVIFRVGIQIICHYVLATIVDYCDIFVKKDNDWVGIIKLIKLSMITLNNQFPLYCGNRLFFWNCVMSPIFLLLIGGLFFIKWRLIFWLPMSTILTFTLLLLFVPKWLY